MTGIFQTGASAAQAASSRSGPSSFVEFDLLHDVEKEKLCRDLLAEFGAEVKRENDQGELIHSCVLPFGLHANGDQNPSASLNWRRLTYNCYSCGGGGLLWFIGVCRGTSGEEARKWLGKTTGVGGAEEQSLASLLEFFDAVYGKEARRPEPIPRMDPRVLSPYLKIHPYMTDIRKVPLEVLKRFTVGYGVVRTQSKGGIWIDSQRIIIPHFWKGNLVGWQSRRLLDDGTPKYLSTPDFPKNTTIFNFDAGHQRPIIVESPLSVLRHADHQPMVATFGAEVTERQIRVLGGYDRVTLWFDNDNAGWKATEAVGDALESYCPVFVVDSDWAADPADMDDATVDALVKEAVPFSIWRKPGSLRKWEG